MPPTYSPLHFPIDEIEYRLEFLKNLTVQVIPKLEQVYYDLRITQGLTDEEEKIHIDDAELSLEEFFLSQITKAFPNDSILSEHSKEKIGRGDYRWILDVLDGSVNFLRGNPLFAMSFAIQHRNTNVGAYIFLPSLKMEYEAVHSKGAKQNGKKIQVSEILLLENSQLIPSFPSRFKDFEIREILSELYSFVHKGRSIRRTGSFVIDMCWLSSGIIDGLWERNVDIFDFAGVSLLLKESGGYLTNFKGEEITHFPENVIASNGLIHEQILTIITKSKKDFNLN